MMSSIFSFFSIFCLGISIIILNRRITSFKEKIKESAKISNKYICSIDQITSIRLSRLEISNDKHEEDIFNLWCRINEIEKKLKSE